MHIIEIIPATKIPFPHPQILSYYHTSPLQQGSLVEISLNKRKTAGIVINSRPFSKIEIKKANYQIKPIQKVLSEKEILDKSQIRLISWMRNYYWTPSSLLVKMLVPSSLLKPTKPIIEKINKKLKSTKQTSEIRTEKITEPKLFVENFSERSHAYKLFIAEKLKNGPVLFLAPEKYQLSAWQKVFLKDFKSILIWRGQNPDKSSDDLSPPKDKHAPTPKEQFNQWLKIKNGYKGLIMGTRGAVFAPFPKLSLIIVDEEENSSYKSWDMRPYYNSREIAIELAKIHKCPVVLGSQLPAVTTFYKYKNSSNMHAETKKIIKQPISVIDMKNEIKNNNFSVFSQNLKEKLEKGGQSLLFINRRGHSAFIMCRDCGHVPQCPHCSVPLVYHTNNHWLICHHCNRSQKNFSLCPACQSHRIKFFGAGTQKVEEEIERIFPKMRFNRLDSDSTPSLLQQETIINQFADKKIDTLIATQLILKFLPLIKPKIIGIISIESMLHLPDFSGAEKAFQILFKLTQSNPTNFIMQTYHPESYVIKNLTQENIFEFYKNELICRRELDYPPFSQLIKLIYEHSNFQYAQREAIVLTEKMKTAAIAYKIPPMDYSILGPAPAFISKKRGRHIWQIIIKIKNQEKKSIKHGLLRLVPNNWKLDIDPIETL